MVYVRWHTIHRAQKMSVNTDPEEAGAPNGTSAMRTPPYISFATLLTFLKALKTDGVPPQIDRSVLSKLSGGVQGQMKMALRSLGLMEGDRPTPLLAEIVNAYETPAFEPMLLERLKATFPYVFDLDLAVATPTMLAEAFKVTGAKEDVSRKCRTFFLHAAKRAGVPLGTRLLTGSVPRSPSTGTPRRKAKGQRGSANPENGQGRTETPAPPKGQAPSEYTNALLAKFPAFDPKWPDDIKAKWFAGFEKFMGIAAPKESDGGK
jgi:hypothetical protein